MKKTFILNLEPRQVQLTILQSVAHILSILVAWILFIYLVARAINIEEHHFTKLAALMVLVIISFALSLTSFLFYLRRKKVKTIAAVDGVVESASFKKTTLMAMKYIEIKN